MEIKKMSQNYNIFQRSYLSLQNIRLYLKAYDDSGLKTDFCRVHSSIVWAFQKSYFFKDFELCGRRHINPTFHG